MTKGKGPLDLRRLLEDFRKAHLSALLSALQENLEILEMDKAPSVVVVLEIDFLLMLASEQVARGNPGAFFDQKAARKAYWDLFGQLQRAGCGKLIVGRRGHQTRFRLRHDSDLEDVLVEMNLPYFSDHDGSEARPKKPQSPGPSREGIVDQIKAHKAEIRGYGVASLALFGSVARDEARPESDVDLLVTFKDTVTSDAFFGLKFFLQDLLGRRIDLVTTAALREPIRRAIEPELLSVA